MKTFRLIALLALAALAAACADPITAPNTHAESASAESADGTGFLGGGTRS